MDGGEGGRGGATVLTSGHDGSTAEVYVARGMFAIQHRAAPERTHVCEQVLCRESRVIVAGCRRRARWTLDTVSLVRGGTAVTQTVWRSWSEEALTASNP